MELSRTIVIGLCVAGYVCIVRCLRYRRVEAIKSKHGMLSRSHFAALSADQAQDVLQELVEMEFPKLMGFSIVFALFKTYSLASVSSLLTTTGELSGPETASKRTADTGVLILEFCLNKPSSERSMEAIARMNYLHARYIKAGKISNDDLLFTLSLFALEPVRWISKYEWRALSDFECCASGTFWKAIGDRMEIDFSVLPSYEYGWTDGLHWLNEVQTWSELYERNNMLPADSNHRLALAHLDVIFLNIPDPVKSIGHYLVAAVVGERVQRAMMLPQPSWIAVQALDTIALLRKVAMRWLFLPRFEWKRKKYISPAPQQNGRYSAREYLSYPWYVNPTFSRRWGLKAWITRLLGRKLPGDDDNKYSPEGYKILEVGPTKWKSSGSVHMDQDLLKMRASKPGSCPFSMKSG